MYYHPDYGLFEIIWDDVDTHVPKEIKNELENIFDHKKDGLFHNLVSDNEVDKLDTIYCRICGGKEFYVGSGSYFTALKCIKCKWEACVHDG